MLNFDTARVFLLKIADTGVGEVALDLVEVVADEVVGVHHVYVGAEGLLLLVDHVSVVAFGL